jgi:sugar phosphate isomerase/epimerase
MMKLSFSSLGNPKLPLEKFTALVKAGGYDAMEVRGRPGEHVHWQDGPDRRKEVRKIFADAGLELQAVSTYVFMASRDRGGPGQTDTRDEAGNIEELKKWVDLAGDLGAKNVRVFGGGLTAGETHADALPRVARIMAAGAKVNPAINVALESHDVWNTGKLIAGVLAAAKLPNVKCLWDIAGPAHAGESPEDFVKAVPAAKVAYLHVKDYFWIPGAEKTMYGCLLGAGELPLGRVVSLLKKAKWSGYLNNEWEGVYHPYMPPVEVAIVQGAQKLRELVAALPA